MLCCNCGNSDKFSYLHTKSNAEIDLIIERPGLPIALVEIKSSTKVDEQDLRHLKLLGKDFANSELFCLSQDVNSRIVQNVKCLEWREGLIELGWGNTRFL